MLNIYDFKGGQYRMGNRARPKQTVDRLDVLCDGLDFATCEAGMEAHNTV